MNLNSITALRQIHNLPAPMRQLAPMYPVNSVPSHPLITHAPAQVQSQSQTNLQGMIDPTLLSPEFTRAVSPNSPSSFSTVSSGSGSSLSGSSATSPSLTGNFDLALSPDLNERYLPSPPPEGVTGTYHPNNNLILNSPAIL